ncbi:hypothetical protein RDI58_029997 [Solanum bulbocastanum]|uniref:TCP domain-containing protein n=1 Tax=Solanum bulbocastanum TaxID=147425 RepID=A0AAN8SYR3_SOLBU
MSQDLDNIKQQAQSKKRSYVPPLPRPRPSSCSKQKVGTSSRFGGGEIVEVQGGHIIRSIGRKDRHSKVCTAKGPRDRRVRLAAHTAIQFYDVQDRLGYDRPSKAVDWLIKKAKASIDELAELPPWKPTTGVTSFDQEKDVEDDDNNGHFVGTTSKSAMIMLGQNNSASSSGENANANGSFLPHSLDSDAISDTIKSFFPMGGGSTEGNSSAMQFQSFQEHNLMSRTSSQSQDLKLSLQSFQDPVLLHNHQIEQSQAQFQASNFFTGSTPLIGFDASVWPQPHQQQPVELGRLAAARGVGGYTGMAFGGGAIAGANSYLFNSQPAPPLLQQLFSQNQLLSQRGPLQSSYSPSIRAWIDPSAIAIATADPIHHHQHQHHQTVLPMYSASVSGIGFASEVGGFSGFRIPTRIQGEIEEHNGTSDKPSSASSDSRH